MSDAVIVAIIGVLSLPFTVTVRWFLNRRTKPLEITNSVAASQEAVETMTMVMQSLEKQVQRLEKENNQLRSEINQLRSEISRLHGIIIGGPR